MAPGVKNLPAMWETQVQSLGWKDPLEKGMATHSSILAWRIPWTEEPGGLYSPWGRKELDTTEQITLSLSLGWTPLDLLMGWIWGMEERQECLDWGSDGWCCPQTGCVGLGEKQEPPATSSFQGCRESSSCPAEVSRPAHQHRTRIRQAHFPSDSTGGARDLAPQLKSSKRISSSLKCESDASFRDR